MPRYPRLPNSPYIPDATGDLWYIVLGVPKHLLSIYDNLLRGVTVARGRRGGTGAGQAVRLELLIREIQVRMDRIALQTAQRATLQARSKVAETAKRHSVTNASQSGRLAGSISARPVLLPGLTSRGLGAVGVGNITTMEAGTVNPLSNSPDGYWQAQEDGSTKNVGRRVPGVFQPGEVMPNANQFREHPLFEKRDKGELRYSMLITKPIEARHFLKDGAGDAHVARKLQLAVLEAFIIEETAKIAGLSAGPVARPTGTRRGFARFL